jgi:diguanylate cyclase (GGDEF)-like protein
LNYSDDRNTHADGFFAPGLECEYTRSILIQNRTLIRAACSAAALLAILRCIEQVRGGMSGNASGIALGLILVGSGLLAALAWSASFERFYLPFARIIVPLRNVMVGAIVAGAAAAGESDMLMMLPLALIGPFFFLGLRFRTALVSGVLTLVAFVASAAIFDLAGNFAFRSSALLCICLIACAIAASNLDKLSRAAFLERRAIVRLAHHDALTGLKNRRVFDESLAQLWPQAIEADRGMAILLIDVDHFKAYNDRYGHQAGDKTLRSVADKLSIFIDAPSSVIARYGGEEFAAILYDVDDEVARQTAERMRQAIVELEIPHQGSVADRVTVSIGVAVVRPAADRAPRGVLQLADQALYEAKLKGRNQVEVMNDGDHRMLVTGMFTKGSLTHKRQGCV